MNYKIVSNRAEGHIALCDDLGHAGTIIDALMRARTDPEWLDYWVIDDAGNEYYHDADMKTVFSAACFVPPEGPVSDGLRPGDDANFGKRCHFDEWTSGGKGIILSGIIEGGFREPPEEDRHQRLNYRVRTDDNRVFTPYESEVRIYE